jgi:hypothetical protein
VPGLAGFESGSALLNAHNHQSGKPKH